MLPKLIAVVPRHPASICFENLQHPVFPALLWIVDNGINKFDGGSYRVKCHDTCPW